MAENEAINAALEGIRATREAKQTERATVAEQLKAIDAELRQLTKAERALDPSATPARRESATDAALAVMREKGTATQSQVAEAMGKPKNTAKSALEKLVDQGHIVATGKFVNRSPEFEIVEVAA